MSIWLLFDHSQLFVFFTKLDECRVILNNEIFDFLQHISDGSQTVSDIFFGVLLKQSALRIKHVSLVLAILHSLLRVNQLQLADFIDVDNYLLVLLREYWL